MSTDKLQKEIKELRSENISLRNNLDQISHEFILLKNSYRWKIGDKVINGFRKLARKPYAYNLHERNIEGILQKFRKSRVFLPKEYNGDKIRINIITPTTNIHGGTKRLVTIAHLLEEKGYHVRLLRQFPSRELDWYDTDLEVENCFFNEETSVADLTKILPDGDVLINYGNNKCAYLLDKLPSSKGVKYNLFMHFGVHDQELDIRNAILANIKPIATTSWIAKQIKFHTNESVPIVNFGVHTSQFFSQTKNLTDAKFVIGALYHKDDWKRSQNVVEAYKILKNRLDINLVMFGQPDRPDDLDNSVEYHQNPKQSQIQELYNKCHVWITSSDFEGIGMCSVEAMLLKTPLITTKSGGSDDFCFKDNCTFIETNSVDSIVDQVLYTKDNYKEVLLKAEKAYDDIKAFDWQKSVRKIENVFLGDLEDQKNSGYRYDLTVGIPIHNQLDFVKDCVRSVQENTTCSYHIVLVDDNSGGETKCYLEELEKENDNISLIRNSPNKGFPFNCNLIITNSEAPYICLLNSDTIVTHGWQENLIYTLQRERKCAMVGPSTSYGVAKNYDGIAQQLEEVFFKRFDMSYEDIQEFGEQNQEDNFGASEETEYLNGFCMFLNRDIVNDIGFFDTQFGLGSREEVQYVDRIKKVGKTVKWVKDSYVHHYGHQSFDLINIDDEKLWDDNKKLYFDQKGKVTRVGLPESKVLFVYNAKYASSTRKRTFEFTQQLQKYIDCQEIHWKSLSEEHFKVFDIIVLQRIGGLNEEIDANFLIHVKKWVKQYPKVRLIYDIDDLVIHSQNELPVNLMKIADQVTCTTPVLQRELQKVSKNVKVLRNGINIEKINELGLIPKEIQRELKVVCFSLGGAGIEQFDELSLNFKGEPISFHFYSGETFDKQFENITLHGRVEFNEMMQVLFDSDVVVNFDDHTPEYFEKLESQYGLLSSERDAFVDGKSGLKYYNAAYSECAFITTPRPQEYSDLVLDGETGFVCNNSNEFIKALRLLVDDKKRFRDIIVRAKQDVVSKYNTTTLVLDYLEFLKEIES